MSDQSDAHGHIVEMGGGATCSLERDAGVSRDRTTGRATSSPTVVASLACLRGSYTSDDMAGGQIQTRDFPLTVSGRDLEAASFIPVSGDRVVLDGMTMPVVSAHLLKPTGVLLYARLQVRA